MVEMGYSFVDKYVYATFNMYIDIKIEVIN